MLTSIYFLNYTNFINISVILYFLIILITSIFIILLKDIIKVIFFFIFICLCMTELCLVLKMEFLALNFIIIYLGAICVLILFQAKLVKLLTEKFNLQTFKNNNFILIIFVLLMILFLNQIFKLIMIQNYTINLELINTSLIYTNWLNNLNTLSELKIIGLILYKYNILYLIIGCLILILAMIGTIILTLEKKKIIY